MSATKVFYIRKVMVVLNFHSKAKKMPWIKFGKDEKGCRDFVFSLFGATAVFLWK